MHFTYQLTGIYENLKSNISEAYKVQVDRLKDSETDSYDKNDMKEKVNDLVRLHEAMQEKLKTASYSSPGLLLIAESISVDISGKPTVVFFLKITSPS